MKHPKGLYILFITEMWERFSYYGMRAIFTLFMVKALMFDKAFASQIYGSYTGLVYLTPLIGGYIADRFWGNRKSIIIGGIIMAIGQFLMFASGSMLGNLGTASLMMYAGLAFMIFGNGFFKPNISTMVGQLYPEGDRRKDAAFTIFYMGINLGAFIAPLVCGGLGEQYDSSGAPITSAFRWGFFAAGVGMIISVILFVWLKDKYIVTPEGLPIGGIPEKKSLNTFAIDSPDEIKKEFSSTQIGIWGGVAVALFAVFFWVLDMDLIGSFIFSATIAAPGLIISDPNLTKIEKDRIWVIYIIAFFVIFFWASFEQAGASLTFFAEGQTNRSVFGYKVPASFFQSINPIAIVILAPLFAGLWTKLGSRGKEPSSPYKQAIGLFLLAVGYMIIAVGVKDLAPGVKISMLWLVSLYTVHTVGELCLSPIGLSMVNKLAPMKFASLLMGVWFLSTAAANKFAGTLSSLYPEPFVPYEVVQTINTSNNVNLVNGIENVESKIDTINNQACIPLELLKFGEIKEEAKQDAIYVEITKSSVVKEKSFIGFKIDTLYSFFMVFIVMSGIAAIILFFLSRKLMKMMHGVE